MGRDALSLRRAQARSRGRRRGVDPMVPRRPRALQMPPPCDLRRNSQDLDGQDPEIQAARDGEIRLAVKSIMTTLLRHGRAKTRPSPPRVTPTKSRSDDVKLQSGCRQND